MTTRWERQIAHIDRRVGPLDWVGVRGQLRKAAVRKRRGLPSRNISLEAMFDRLHRQIAARKGEPPDHELAAKLQWQLCRERLLERKRTQRDAARHRTRVSADDTKINLWSRRREWLRMAEELRLS